MLVEEKPARQFASACLMPAGNISSASRRKPSRSGPAGTASKGAGRSGEAYQPARPSKVVVLSPNGVCATTVRCPGAFAYTSTGTLEKSVSKPPYMPFALRLFSAASFPSPPAACRYLSSTSSALGPFSVCGEIAISLGSSGGGALYCASRLGVPFGSPSPRWHVKQVTTCLPPKFSWLIAFTICTIRRAVRFAGISSAYFAQSPRLSMVWQLVQLYPSDALKNPMVSMNSTTEIPFSTCTFLKTSSTIRVLSAPVCAAATLHSDSVKAAAPRTEPFDCHFIPAIIPLLTFAEYARSLLRGTGLLRAARYRQERYAAIAPVRLYPPVARLPGIFPPQGHWLGVAGLRQDGPQGGAPLGAPA